MGGVEAGGPLLAAIEWDLLLQQLYHSPSYQVVVGSGLLLSVGLLGRYMRALTSLHQGQRPDFLAPVFRLVLFAVVVTHYQQIGTGLLRFVTDLGHGMLGEASVEQLWEQRRSDFFAYLQQASHDAEVELMSRDALVQAGLTWAAHASLCLSQVAILAVRTLQVFLLVVLFLFGPWLLALAFVGGPFTGLGSTWLLGTLEVAAWSWGLKMLAFCLHKVLPLLAQASYTLSCEITVSLTLATCVLAVPWTMARLWRRQTWNQAVGAAHAAWGLGAWPAPQPTFAGAGRKG